MSDRRTILILSANPKGTNPLCLGEEVREVSFAGIPNWEILLNVEKIPIKSAIIDPTFRRQNKEQANIFALLFFCLTQLAVEQQLAETRYTPTTNLRPSCPRCGSYHTIKKVLLIMENRKISVRIVVVSLSFIPVRRRYQMRQNN